MKIAFINQPFEYITPDYQGSSIWIWTYEIMRALAARPCEIVVYARQYPDQPRVESRDGIEYRRFPTDRDELFARPAKLAERLLGFPRPRRPFFSTDTNYRSYIQQIARDLQENPCDIVHIPNFSQFVLPVRALNPETKIVLHMGCEWLAQLDAEMIASRLQAADLVLGCSDHITGQIQRRFPQFTGRCRTIHNGVRFEQFSLPNGKLENQTPENTAKRLLYVGRVSPEKGVHVLLQAFEKVVQEYPDVNLDIVGPIASAPYELMVLISNDPKVQALASFYPGFLRQGDYETALKRFISPLIAERINFTGAVEHAEVVRYYHGADILINPSLTEAFGMSLVEAMASKLPTVASSVGGMINVVEQGQTGWLVPSDDPEELARAILRLLKEDRQRLAMGEAGYRRAERLYSWQTIADNLWGYYQDLLPTAHSVQQ